MKNQHKAFIYRVFEVGGMWSRMGVMVLAFMVMLVELGSMVHFSFGPAVWAFVFCVAISILASICFDPHTIWDDTVPSENNA